jgi:hypothetical protein
MVPYETSAWQREVKMGLSCIALWQVPQLAQHGNHCINFVTGISSKMAGLNELRNFTRSLVVRVVFLTHAPQKASSMQILNICLLLYMGCTIIAENRVGPLC